jgi:hypothetical protein
MFQHRHYVELAKMVGQARDRMKSGPFADYVEEWADMLTGTNPRFDRQRFVTACHGKPVNSRDNGARIPA